MIGEECHVTLTEVGAEITFNGKTGLLCGLLFTDEEIAAFNSIDTSVSLVTGGIEERDPFGGLVYPGALRCTESELIDITGPRQEEPDSVVVRTRTASYLLIWSYRFATSSPRVRLNIQIVVENGLPVRNLELSFTFSVDPRTARVDSPGNRIRPGLVVDEMSERLVVNTAGGTPGSSGLMVVGSLKMGSIVVWPLATQAIGEQWIQRFGSKVTFGVSTGIAGAPLPGGSLKYGPLYLDVVPSTWPEFKSRMPDWYRRVNLCVPDEIPAWTRSTSIYEVQIGRSLFGGVADYSPYPTVSALRDDLERIASLGFDTLQIMPRQPFPSYNVVDYADISTSYGESDDLRLLVKVAHEHGMRVILDVIMHGVLDRGSVRLAADGVRHGPHASFLAEHSFFSVADAAHLPRADQIPWSRHILEFEQAWHDGAMESHPLVRDHPDWFFRLSNDEMMGIYTWAFELGNSEWQCYFEKSLLALIERLDLDGFRFDAPTYNHFPNWSPMTREHASDSELAAIGLFARLRDRIKRDRPEFLFYTEPSGVLLRQSMDINYNYDEHAQLEDLMGIKGSALGAHGSGTVGIRNAHDLMAWFEDRNASLPPKAVTAHHIDSHDTFWWGRPGLKWRREQLGIAGARALLSVFALSGGPYMTFVGGELGMEHHLVAVNALRRRPEFLEGITDFTTTVAEQADVYTVTRRSVASAAVVIVNLSPDTITTRVVTGEASGRFRDLLTGDVLEFGTGMMMLSPYQTIVLSIEGSEL